MSVYLLFSAESLAKKKGPGLGSPNQWFYVEGEGHGPWLLRCGSYESLFLPNSANPFPRKMGEVRFGS